MLSTGALVMEAWEGGAETWMRFMYLGEAAGRALLQRTVPFALAA